MNLYQLIVKSQVDRESINGLSTLNHRWITNTNNFLSSLSKHQLKILVRNISPIKNKDQLLDHLSEIVVASTLENKDPFFFSDDQGKPDIFLQKLNEYVEVKRLNNSDYEKRELDILVNSECMTGKKIITNEKNVYPITKSISLINNALKKFTRNKLTTGSIYLLFSLDKLGQILDWNLREEAYLKNIHNWWNENNATTISLKIYNENKLFVR